MIDAKLLINRQSEISLRKQCQLLKMDKVFSVH